MLALTLAMAAPALGQAARPRGNASASVPVMNRNALARYIPRQELVAYAELAGVDAYPAAWRATAAYKLLNETKLGALIEDLGTQLIDNAAASDPDAKLRGADVMAITRHVLRSGAVAGVCLKAEARRPGPQPLDCVCLVLRGAAAKTAREPFDHLLQQATGKKPTKTVNKPGGRKVTVVGEGASAWAWWAENDDLVIALEAESTPDAIIETLAGKRPNALDLPRRVQLTKAEDGLQPVLVAFLDMAVITRDPKSAANLAGTGLEKLEQIDVRWGFQGEALMLVMRLAAPSPRTGILALFDQPTFTRTSLPPLPADLHSFSVLSLQGSRVLDQIQAIRAQERPGRVPGPLADRSVEDLARQLGPMVAFYVRPPQGPAPANPMAGLMAQAPMATLLAQVNDPAAFGKALDQFMVQANQQIKGSWNARQRQPGAPPGRPGAPAGPAPQFEPVPGPVKAYSITLPPGTLPIPGLKPTVMVGKKYVAVSSTTELARQALALESDPAAQWKPNGDYARVFEHLPPNLTVLVVGDPRDSLPALVTNLPQLTQMAGPAAPRLRIDPAQIPSDADLRSRLFPSFLAVSTDAKGVRVVTRDAFVDPTSGAAPAVGVALLLPAVQAAREAARRAQCVNNLKQIGLAMHNYHSVNNHFPPAAITDKAGKPLLSWRVALLPYIEQQALYAQFKLDEPWDSPHNRALVDSMPATFGCPSTPTEGPGLTTYEAFVGKGAAFEPGRALELREFTDGTSNTIAVVESKNPVPWTKPVDLPYDPNGPLPAVGSPHPGGYNALFVDGSVRFLKNTVPEQTLRALITRAGGEPINPDEAAPAPRPGAPRPAPRPAPGQPRGTTPIPRQPRR